MTTTPSVPSPVTSPRLPRLCRGLTILATGDAILIDGGPRRRRLTGTTATSLLPRVLPLLDGARETATIAAEAGAQEIAITRLIDVLDDCGLLEWPDAASPASEMADHVATYFSRNISRVNGFQCTEDIACALAGATVMLVAAGPAAPQIAADLIETGVADVRIRATPGSVSADDLGKLTVHARSLVAVLDDGGPSLSETVACVRETGTPVLRFSRAGDAVEIGPVFFEGWTACVDCFMTGYRRLLSAAAPPTVPASSATSAYAATLGMTAALVTSEILALLAHVSDPGRPWCMTRITGFGRQTERFDVLAESGCPACDHSTLAASAESAGELLARAYEWQHERRPAALTPPEDTSRERQRYFSALQRERDSLPPAPARHLADIKLQGQRQPLPDSDGLCPADIDQALIADLLARTAGSRTSSCPDLSQVTGDGNRVDRWPASAGNLASAQLYIATRQNLFGLPGTIFKYDDLGHRVISVRADAIPLARLLAGTDFDTGSVEVALIFVGAVARLSRKYGDFALRLACLDAGCAALQLSLAASARHVAVSFASAWTDDLAAQLELEPNAEIVTAVAGIHRKNPVQHLEGGRLCR